MRWWCTGRDEILPHQVTLAHDIWLQRRIAEQSSFAAAVEELRQEFQRRIDEVERKRIEKVKRQARHRRINQVLLSIALELAIWGTLSNLSSVAAHTYTPLVPALQAVNINVTVCTWAGWSFSAATIGLLGAYMVRSIRYRRRVRREQRNEYAALPASGSHQTWHAGGTETGSPPV